ncbi:MAG: hypothetical protein J3K34DRAFT_437257, partial [Monoraphidium minutum]
GGVAAAPLGAPDGVLGGEGGTRDLLRVVAFTFAVILFVTPCLVAYSVELSWKLAFLRCERMRFSRPADDDGLLLAEPAGHHSWFRMAVFAYVAMCIVWLWCDAAAAALP